MKNFYKRFGLVTRLPFWRYYLHTAHKKGFDDARILQGIPQCQERDFIALQCGTAGEITTDEFLKSVFSQNSNARAIIIDLGNEQIQAVKELVNKKYKDKQISIKQANALNLGFIPHKSVNWIETDGFLAFFDKIALPKLLKEWKRILIDNGFITFRDFASNTLIEKLIDSFRIQLAKYSVRTNLTARSKAKMDASFSAAGFRFSSAKTLIPGFYRYCLVKK